MRGNGRAKRLLSSGNLRHRVLDHALGRLEPPLARAGAPTPAGTSAVLVIVPSKHVALAEALGRPETLLADSGYFSEANVAACAGAQIAPGRERHHRSWKDRFAEAPPARPEPLRRGEGPPPPDNPTPVKAMLHRLATPEGRKAYALRK